VAPADGYGGIVVTFVSTPSWFDGRRFAGAFLPVVMMGCETTPSPNGHSASRAIPVSIAALSTDPWPLEDKWVVVEGWASVSEHCCDHVYDLPDIWDDTKPFRPFNALDFSEGGKPSRVPLKFDRQHVRVIGKVDLTCVRAHESVSAQNEAFRAGGDDRFIMVSGFCHTSGDPSLSQAKFEIIR
jgi:hypothetical protein